VHARGRISWMQDAAWLRELLDSLTDRHERGYANPWRMSDAPSNYIDGMLAAIVGFEIAIETLTGKWKVSQNRSNEDRAGVVSSLSGFADDASQQMAKLVEFPDHGTGD
jgi:transcriptional regulator